MPLDAEGYSEWPEGDGQHVLSYGSVFIKFHIDHMGNEDKDVWAIQWKGAYFIAHAVEVMVPLTTVFNPSGDQPHAWLEGKAVVHGFQEGPYRELYLL